MDLERFTAQMDRTARIIQQMVQGVSDEQARWKPEPASWSILEVINHLHDEEQHDFRTRLDIMLHRPQDPLPGFDPEARVKEQGYNDRDLTESVQNFMEERHKSLQWLATLKSPDWDAVYETPRLRMTAGDMFASWVAHDLLHMRQLVELHWRYTTQGLGPHKVDYAGPW